MKKKIIISLILFMIISVINNYYGRYYLSLYNNYYIKQLIWFLIGFIIIFVLSKLNIDYILNKSLYLYLFGIFLLIITLFIGKNINGSKSWLFIFGLSFQPSEFMKIFLTLYLRYVYINYDISNLKFILISLLITIIPSILVFLEPDTGPIISYIVIWLTFIYLKRINKWYYITGLSTIFGLIFIFFYMYFYQTELFINIFGTNFFYRIDRIKLFLNNEGYQISTALKSISLSNLFGIKTRVYFPEATTDFAITLLIANFGIVGLIIYLIVDIIFLKNMTTIKKDKLLVYPFVNVFIFQAIINLLMNVGLFPIIGITYPMLSYGGSSTLVYLILVAIIYNMDNKDYNYNHHSNCNHKKGKDSLDYSYKQDLHKQV